MLRHRGTIECAVAASYRLPAATHRTRLVVFVGKKARLSFDDDEVQCGRIGIIGTRPAAHGWRLQENGEEDGDGDEEEEDGPLSMTKGAKAEGAKLKKFGKDPSVNTSFLPDRSVDVRADVVNRT